MSCDLGWQLGSLVISGLLIAGGDAPIDPGEFGLVEG